MTGYVATAETDIDATPEEIWAVLTDPAKLSELWFGARVVTNWQVGSPITWSGVWEGRPYEDKGEVLAVEPGRLLKFTHFSPLTASPTCRRTTTRSHTRSPATAPPRTWS